MQVSQPNGEVIITNDGATILNKMTVTQPAAKMLVELAKAQVLLANIRPSMMLLVTVNPGCVHASCKLSLQHVWG